MSRRTVLALGSRLSPEPPDPDRPATPGSDGPDPHAPCARLTCAGGAVTGANAAAAALLGVADAATLVGRPVAQWLTPPSLLLWEAQFGPLLAARGAVEGAFLTLRTASGDEVPVLVAASTRDGDGGPVLELALLVVRQRVAFEESLRAARDAAEAARAELAATVERQRATEAQLRQAQKLEAVGRLAGGVAHEFNNMLTLVAGHLDLARTALAELAAAPGGASDASTLATVLDDLATVGLVADRAGGVVRQLLAFSRQQVLAPGEVDLNACVRRAEEFLPRLLGRQVAWRSEPAPDLWPVVADAAQVEQVLLNLALNARDAIRATGRGGRLTVATENVDDGAAGWVRLTVRDTGVGMDAETRARAFEPFFTTKPVGDGSGLGLAMVYGIAQQSGGRARLDSEPGAGTTVVVEFPRATRGGPGGAPEGAAAPPGAAGASDPRPAAAPEARTVLLVEDETMVRVLGRRILEAAGYRVLEAVNGAEGLERWRERRTEIDAVVSDVRMPVLDGHALAAALRAEATDVPVLLVSGYSEHEVAPGGARAGFLEKPYTAASLLGALAALGVAPRR